MMNNDAIINPRFSTFNWLDDDVFENDNDDDDSLFIDPLFLFKVRRVRVIKHNPQGIY